MVNPHMRISVISFNGAPLAQASGFNFDNRGGSIGREEGNELVLPDPERHISRVQARVEFDGANFLLVDQGGNPSAVNDRPVGKGNRVMLAGGDRITIGGYVLEVEFDRQAPVFSTPAVASSGGADPLGLFGASSSGGADPFGGLFGAPGQGPSPASPGSQDDPFAVFAATPRPAPDADTVADPFAPAPPPPPPRAPDADLLGLGGGRNDTSVDALFGLNAGGTRDPFLGTPLGDPGSVPAAAGAETVDPLALFGGPAAPPPVASPQRDDAPVLKQAFTPPRAEPPPAAGEMVFSWDQSLPGPAMAPSASVPLTVLAEPAARAEISVDRVAPQPVAAPAPAPGMPAEQGELLEAFLRGLGVPLRLPAGLTPELMEQIGVVLRESTQGTLDLLTARALTKREVRAEVTMIVSKGNNPLKFSPDVGFALTQLLVPQGRGFMPPDEAMRDAYDDLRAHQFGFMAGMRAALSGVLKRFEPAALEQRVLARSVLDSLLPGARKARLWDLFEQMYGEISREAEDDFHALFGREFLRAYEEQVERLQAERDPEHKA